MEEARQHSTLTTAEWVAVAGRLGGLFTSLAILVAAFVGQGWVIRLGVVFLGFAILNAGANLYTAVSDQTFQWNKTKSTRAEKPLQYLLFVTSMLGALALYLALAKFLIGEMP